MKRLFTISVFILFYIIELCAQMGNDSTLESLLEFSIEELMNTKVSIATKSEKSLNVAPSIVTVISSDVIKNSGARDITDILQYVPGFEFSKPRAGYPSLGIRGVKDLLTTARFLILKDGVPYNDIMYGSGIAYTQQFDVNTIDRIEVIRGPGSALYGRNAFIGVINIITKSGTGKDEVDLFTSVGQFNTLDYGVSYGTKVKDFDAVIAVTKSKSDNTNSMLNDGMGGESVWNLDTDNLFANTKLHYKSITLTGMYSDIVNGMSAGPFSTQSDKSTKMGLYSLEYTKSLYQNLIFNSKIYGRNESQVQHIEIYTPYTLATKVNFPNGVYATPQFKSYTYGTDVNLSSNFGDIVHSLIGLQADLYGINEVELKSSYDTYTSAPLKYIIDDSTYFRGKDTQIKEERGWIEGDGHDYYNMAFYFQGIFTPIEKFSLTVGGRYDIDSEFGGIFNPRLGVVWKTQRQFIFKLLYGQAYRAPNSNEQYRKTGFTIGNENLKPETIKTTEFSVDYNIGKNINNRLTLFYNVLNNMIYARGITSGAPGSPYSNIGENKSMGLEYEYRMILNKHFYAFFNYSYTSSINDVTQNDTTETFNARDIAPHKVNLGANYKFLSYFNLNANLTYRGEREKYYAINRQTGDYIYDTDGNRAFVSQDEIGNYFILNAKLRVKDFLNTLELSAEVYNLLDTKYYDQDTEYAHQPLREGRQFIFTASYRF
jgi:iron complex outermembrane receptor protein